MELRLTDYE